MQTKFRPRNESGNNGPTGKGRVTINGNRLDFDPTRIGGDFTENDQVTPYIMRFEGNAANDAAVTLKKNPQNPDALSGGDRIVIEGRNSGFVGDLWIQLNRGDEVIFVEKLVLSKFDGPNFKNIQIQTEFAFTHGENIDIRLKQYLGQETQGLFELKSIKVAGDIPYATEVTWDSKGNMIDLDGNQVNTGPELLDDLDIIYDDGKGIHRKWFRLEKGKGEYIKTYSGTPNINRYSPDDFQEI